MPKITVREKDLSWYYQQRDPGQLVVLMPIVSEFGPIGEPTLVNSSNFAVLFGKKSVDSKDLSYNMAASFIASGANVLAWRVPLSNTAAAAFTYENKDVNYFLTKDTEASESKVYYTKTESGDFVKVESPSGNPKELGYYEYDPLQKITVTAKYPGAYGNDFSVKIVKTNSTGDYRFFVYNKEGATIESLFVNFSDLDSKFYYETVNRESSFIEVSNAGTDPFSSAVPQGKQSLVGGSNGDYSHNDVYNYLAGSESDEVFNDLTDLLVYDFNLIQSAGYSVDDSGELLTKISDVDDKFIALAERRGSAVYLVDGARTWTPEEFYSYIGFPFGDGSSSYKPTTDEIVQSGKTYYVRSGEAGSYVYTKVDSPEGNPSEKGYFEFVTISIKSSAGFNTSYAAAFGPWVSARYTSSGSTRELPGSYALIISWAQSLASGTPLYYPPAGVKRAVLNFVTGSQYNVGQSVLDLWQNGELTTLSEGRKINPIMKIKQYGYIIYGNSTLLRSLDDGSTSMLQSFSTRVLANLIKTQAFNISLTLQFDQITDDLFAEFRTLMSTFMDQLKYGGALYDYRIVADRENTTLDELNNKTVPVLIQISPNPAAENFDITLEISQAGLSFSTESEF